MRRAVVGLLLFLAVSVQCHSWIECSNYLINSQSDKEYYNKNNCVGFPRCAAARNGIFGNEGPLAYLQSKDSCQCNRDSLNAYTSTTPKATYTPGQRVCLAYPAKNHVADKCTNQHIPDTGMRIYRSAVGETSDPPLFKWPHEYSHLNGQHVNGVIDYKGFQNCPKFCENMDKALCTVCFDLEANLAPGTYSFHWEWQFNPGESRYVSCWEADVVSGTPSMVPQVPGPTPAPTPVPTPASTRYDDLECDE